MERLGLSYEALRDVNPGIVYVGMPGFGRTGPFHDFVAYGPSIEPMTGMTMLMGYGDGEPRVSTKALPDAIAGTQGAAAVLNGLLRRARSGAGCAVDFSQFEAGVEMLGEYFIEHQLTGCSPPVVGNGHRSIAPHGTYRTSGDDEWIAIAARSEHEWNALCAIARQGWELDPRFESAESRHAHASALDVLVENWTRNLDKFSLMAELQRVRVPAGAVLNAPQMLADPHLQARGFFAALDQPDVGVIEYPGTPIRIGGAPRTGWFAGPSLGQHNDELLTGLLGLSPREVEGLYTRGITTRRPPG